MNKKAQLDEIVDNPAFWLLGGGAVIATIFGYIISKRAGWEVLPLWQMGVIIIVELIAAAFFALRE